MELRITIEELKNKGLSLTQYIFIWGLYNQVKVKYLGNSINSFTAPLK